jgi:2-oxoglutarate ferredoxin oxidoreductase subunit delta
MVDGELAGVLELVKKEEQEKESPAVRSPDGQPDDKLVIYGNWCKACQLCIAFCPVQALAAGEDGRPYLAEPDKCTACGWCEIHCPDMAIYVKREEG